MSNIKQFGEVFTPKHIVDKLLRGIGGNNGELKDISSLHIITSFLWRFRRLVISHLLCMRCDLVFRPRPVVVAISTGIISSFETSFKSISLMSSDNDLPLVGLIDGLLLTSHITGTTTLFSFIKVLCGNNTCNVRTM